MVHRVDRLQRLTHLHSQLTMDPEQTVYIQVTTHRQNILLERSGVSLWACVTPMPWGRFHVILHETNLLEDLCQNHLNRP